MSLNFSNDNSHPNLLVIHPLSGYYASYHFCNEFMSWMIEIWIKQSLNK